MSGLSAGKKVGRGRETGPQPARFFSLQMLWVMVPMGQKAHQERGRYNTMTISPISVDVSMRL